MKKKFYILNILIIIILMFIALIPFYFLCVKAMSSTEWLNIFVPQFYFINFVNAWNSSQLGRAMLNSLIMTSCTVILIVFVTSMAGYAFARINNVFHKIALNAILLSMLIPSIINTVQLYSLMRQINGINTYWALILLMTTANLPFAIFLYTSFIQQMSCEIEEAAYIDGCSKFNTFWLITFPLLKPVTSAVIILNAVAVWNNYNFAVFFLQDQSMQTVPLAISSFFQTYGANWNLMAAAALIGLLPPVAVFLAFQKYFIKGIGSGALKG
jgi:raffinose/stachyose/melibiose transport system permease protein